MRCFYCGKRQTSRNLLYNLDKDGHKICQSCMREGYTKTTLEIIEHNKQVDMRNEDGGEMKGTRCEDCVYYDELKTEQPCCGCVDFVNFECDLQLRKEDESNGVHI